MRKRVSLSKGVRRGVCVGVLLALIGCRTEAPYVVPETPMPPNTILLSQMMRELSATPGFTDALLAQLDRRGEKRPALVEPRPLKPLGGVSLGYEWPGLDSFARGTVHEGKPDVGGLHQRVDEALAP